jgi:phosphatidylglycerophosphatase A
MKAPLFLRLLPDAPIVRAATLHGLGNLGRAPGTLGALAGLLWFSVLFHQIGEIGALIVATALLVPAVWLCGEAELRMRRHDPGSVILDEFVVIPVCFIGMGDVLSSGRTWLVLLLGFAFFRLFDIAKPPPVRQLQRLPGGLGIVADDLAAAVLACLSVHALLWWRPAWFAAG